VRLNDGRADRQAEAESVVLGGIKRFEQSASLFDARPAVFHDNLDGAGRRRARGDRDLPLWDRRRSHRIHRVHDQVKQHLLQLDGIPGHRGQVVRQIGIDHDPAANHLAAKQGSRRIDQFVDIERFGFSLALLEQVAEPVNDLAGAIVFLHDILQRFSDLGEVRLILR
jgi:hypothetical protein